MRCAVRTVLVPLITNQYVCVFFYGWGCTDIVLKTVVSFFPDSLLQTAFQKMRANFLYEDSRKAFEYFLLWVATKTKKFRFSLFSIFCFAAKNGGQKTKNNFGDFSIILG